MNSNRTMGSIMIESLDELRKQVRAKYGDLYTFYGKQDQIISNLIDELNIESVFFNKDYIHMH